MPHLKALFDDFLEPDVQRCSNILPCNGFMKINILYGKHGKVGLFCTVLQNRVNPKSNAPEISKGATKLERNFQYKSKISQKLNDVRLRKVTFKVNLLWRTLNNHKYRPLKIMLQNIWRHFWNRLFMGVRHVFSVFKFVDIRLRYQKSFSYKKPIVCQIFKLCLLV